MTGPGIATSASGIVYHAGEFVDYADAGFSIEERGIQFSDGLYEVVRFDSGRPFRLDDHLDRLFSGLTEIGFTLPERDEIADVVQGLIEHNALSHGNIYLQVTRGPASRAFAIRDPEAPVVSGLAYPGRELQRGEPVAIGRAVVVDDTRWTRCHIKSLMLLPASLAKTHAHQTGAQEAIFERAKPGTTDRHITEGASSNVFIVRAGRLITPPNDGWILPGVTRAAVIELADVQGIAVEQTCFGRDALYSADEAFVCSTNKLLALSAIDDASFAAPGPITSRLYGLLVDEMLTSAGVSRTR